MVDLKVYQDIQNADNNSDALLAHVGLVKRVALHLKTRLPNFMELDELIQVGMIGLFEANNSYDASKGVEFEVFAKNRIRGAILDQVRKLSYLLGPLLLISAITMRLRRHLLQSSAANHRRRSLLILWAKILKASKKSALMPIGSRPCLLNLSYQN